MRPPFQTALYSALDKQTVFVNNNGRPYAIPVADFTLLLSTTDEFKVLQPLRDRCRILLKFDFYSEGELAEILRRRIFGLQWTVDEQILPLIAQRSRGTPRLALRLLSSCHRVSRSLGESRITLEHFLVACDLEQLDCFGLGPTEQKYLCAVAEGANRLNVISSILGLAPRTISDVTEPFLIRKRLICKDDQGRRQLTLTGREHLQKEKDEYATSSNRFNF